MVSCGILLVCTPVGILGGIWTILGRILVLSWVAVSYSRILGYPGPYPAPYLAVSWPYLGRILQLDVGAENMVVGMALASSIQITNKPFGALL